MAGKKQADHPAEGQAQPGPSKSELKAEAQRAAKSEVPTMGEIGEQAEKDAEQDPSPEEKKTVKHFDKLAEQQDLGLSSEDVDHQTMARKVGVAPESRAFLTTEEQRQAGTAVSDPNEVR